MPKKFCCNPFRLDEHNCISKNVRKASERDMAEASKFDIVLLQGEYICFKCKQCFWRGEDPRGASTSTGAGRTATAPSNTDDSDDSEYEQSEQGMKKSSSLKNLNETLSSLSTDTTPIRLKRFGSNKYKKRKFEEVKKVLGDLFQCDPDGSSEEERTDESEIVQQFKLKMPGVSTSDKYRMLTSLPFSWSARKLSSEMGVTRHMARKAKDLIAQKGAMSAPERKLGSRHLDENTLRVVNGFYLNDENSRACPGKNEYVTTVNEDGSKEKKQRRLLLSNLHEAFEIFKEQYPHLKISFSKFASLRPKECVTAYSAHGIHNVCVCMYHQNVELIFDGLYRLHIFEPSIGTYKDLLKQLMCYEPTEKCHMHECRRCPGVDVLSKKLAESFETNLLTELSYKQWTTISGKKIKHSSAFSFINFSRFSGYR